jgi:hypothetical protein
MLRRYSPHAPRPHWRTPTQREMEVMHKKKRITAKEALKSRLH